MKKIVIFILDLMVDIGLIYSYESTQKGISIIIKKN